MDGASSSRGRDLAPSREEVVTEQRKRPTEDRHEIFVRAHTTARTNSQRDRRWFPAWPTHCLIFDTETTLDSIQTLNLGAYRRCKLVGDKYLCEEEGVFYRDDVSESDLKLLQRYRNDPETLPLIETFPGRTNLPVMSRAEFVRRVFWKSVRKGQLIVGFNLPFDLSRLATQWTEGKKGDWSLSLSHLWKNPKTGRVVPNPLRPRIVVDSQNSKMAFIKLGSILLREEWPYPGRFVDLRTLAFALRNVSYSLSGACRAFRVEGNTKGNEKG